MPNYYPNTLVCYSYSKSLSLPGQRIGYVLVPPQAEDADIVYAAVCGAGRALGYVCAPSLFQLVAAECTGQTADIEIYHKNRDLLLNALRDMGYTCAQPLTVCRPSRSSVPCTNLNSWRQTINKSLLLRFFHSHRPLRRWELLPS